MKPAGRSTVILVVALAAMPALGAAQEPVTSFDQLNTRLKVGNEVWVTDAQGEDPWQDRTHHRRCADAERLQDDCRGVVSLVRYRENDSLKNGTLIGLGIGGSLGLAWCLAAAADDSPRVSTGVECAEGFSVYGGLGTLLGLVIDAAIPGKMRVAYRAAGAPGASNNGRLSTGLIVRPHAKGVAVSFSF